MSSRAPLVLICDDPGRGGCAAVARTLLRALAEDRPTCLVTDLEGAPAGVFSPDELAGRSRGALVHHPVDEKRADQSAYAVRPALELMQRLEPALVVFHDSRALTSMLALKRAARLTRTPFLAVQHLVPPDFTAACGGRWARRWPSKAERIVFVSRENKERFAAAAPGAAAKAVLIPNGVMDAAPRAAGAPTLRSLIGAPAHARIALLLGRLDPGKGQDVAVRALAALRRRTGADVRLALVGPDADGYGGQVRALARDLGVENAVAFLGWRPDGRALLAQADAALQLGRAEGLPLSLLEAMAEGAPIVAAAAGDVADALAPDAGLLAEPSAGESLDEAVARALARVVGEPAVAETLRARARARFEERYTLRAMTESHRRLVEEIERGLAPPRRRRPIAAPPTPRRYAVEMTEPRAAWDVARGGWIGPHPWGVMGRERCGLQLPLGPRRAGDQVRLDFDLVFPGRRVGREVEVTVGGARPVVWLFLGARGEVRRTIVVPATESLGDRIDVALHVRAPGLALRPPPVEDGRRLGLGLRRITVEVLSPREGAPRRRGLLRPTEGRGSASA